MPMIDLLFSINGKTLPCDHAYPLYSALSRMIPELHDPQQQVFIGPVRGLYAGQGLLQLDSRSRLRLRLSSENIATILPLAGKQLDIAGHILRLGVPQVYSLIPAPAVVARMVTIKRSNRHDSTQTRRYMEPEAFLEGAKNELTKLGIRGEPSIPLVPSGFRAGQPRRHVLKIKDKCIVGFTLQVNGLTTEESITLQEIGLGGRKKMGCGFFGPIREKVV